LQTTCIHFQAGEKCYYKMERKKSVGEEKLSVVGILRPAGEIGKD